MIADASERAIPHKIVTIRPKAHPWFTSTIKKLIRKRKRAYKKYKRTSILHYWAKYKRLRNICVKEIRESKKSYYENLERLLSIENANFEENLKTIVKFEQRFYKNTYTSIQWSKCWNRDW